MSAHRTSPETYAAYRDAVGFLCAARRGDHDALEWFQLFQPALKTRSADALLAVSLGLMRELERMGGDPEALLARWATNIAMREAEA